jgi:glycosyltransferase involved in cell wall biosynthesis
MKPLCDVAVQAHSEDSIGEPDLITVICLSFNTRDYIAQCFDAILSQKINYRLQIVVHDDASSDGSQDLIREYADRYPAVFTPVLQPTNRWSLGFCPLRASAEHVKGGFVAICEVDDYWTEPDKLQQQVEFLRGSRRNFVGTQCRSIRSNEDSGYAFPKAASDGPITVIRGADIFAMRKYIHTSTFFMLRTLFDKWAQTFDKQVVSADLTILLTACLVDDGLALQNRVTSRYRSHESGMWTGSARAERYARYATTWRTILDSLRPELTSRYLRLAQNNLVFFQIMSKKSKPELIAALAHYGPAAVFRVGLNMLIRRLLGN